MDASLYDDQAERYDRHNATNPWNELYDRPAIHALVGDVAGLDVLDVGCASGVLSAQLHGRGARVVGLDASPVLVGLAAERYPDIRFHQADLAEPLDFLAEFYHRSLGAMFAALRAAGFRVDEIVEPMPLPRVEVLDRRAHELLTRAPRYLYFRAVNG